MVNGPQDVEPGGAPARLDRGHDAGEPGRCGQDEKLHDGDHNVGDPRSEEPRGFRTVDPLRSTTGDGGLSAEELQEVLS